MEPFPFVTYSSHKNTDRKIPCTVMQTWKTRYVPENVAAAMHAWRNLNPEFDFYFFGDEESRAYLEKNFTSDVLIEKLLLLYKKILWEIG